MSTKTTFKRVALVAVAALGLGVLSVAPSQATHIGDSLTLTPVTSAIAIGETATATVNSSFTGVNAGDSITVTAIQYSPNASNGQLGFAVVDSYTSTVSVASAAAAGTASVYTGVTADGKVANTNYKLNFIQPTKSGTYVFQVYASATGGAGVIRSSILTWTVTVAAAAKSAAAITHLVAGTNSTNPAIGQADSSTAGSKAATARIGSIGVKLYTAANTEVTTESFTATISGAGTLGSTSAGTAVVGRSITVKYGDDVRIYADGTGGVGTVTISTAAGLVVATKTVSFYGDPAAIVLSSNSNAAVGTALDAIKATVYDAAGYPVAGAQLYTTSADTTIITANYAPAAKTTAADGTATISLTGAKLGSTKITVGLASSAADTTSTVKSDATSVTVAGGTTEQANVIVTTDKSVYAPGSYAYVTVKPVDKDGKTLAPGTYTVFATGGISGSLPFDTVTGNIASTSFVGAVKAGTATAADPIVALAGEYVYKIKLPTYSGNLTLSWTTAAASNFPGNIANGGVAGSVTVALSDPGSQAAVDAAAEATDAANAATDAALAAADAADAATAAAQDASDAVAALSASVSKLVAALKAQITTLTNLVIKIQKKVKA